VAARIVVLVSGGGTTLQALLDATDAHYRVMAVISDDGSAAALDRAARHGVATEIVAPRSYADRAEWDRGLAEAIRAFEPDWVVCAGFMRILGPAVLECFPQRIVNTHPALLPSFPGGHGVRDALAYGVKVTGCTVHIVDAGVDTGPIIAQAAVPVHAGDDEDLLHERIKQVERGLLVTTVNSLAQHGCTIEGRKVTTP